MANWVSLGTGIHICDIVKEERPGQFAGKECNWGTYTGGESFTPRIYIAVVGYGPRSGRKIELWHNGSLWAEQSDFKNTWHEIWVWFKRGDGEPLAAGEWEARYYEGTRLKLSKQITIEPGYLNLTLTVSDFEYGTAKSTALFTTNRIPAGLGTIWLDMETDYGDRNTPTGVSFTTDRMSVRLPVFPFPESAGATITITGRDASGTGFHLKPFTVVVPTELEGYPPESVRVIPYAIHGEGIGAMQSWFRYPAGVKLQIGDQELVTQYPATGSMGVIFDLKPRETIAWNVLELPEGYSVIGADPPLGTMVVPDTDFGVELYFIRTDPCIGVTCDDVGCVGADLYSQKCVDGKCVQDVLIEANCPDCEGYVPPEPVCTPQLLGDVNGDGVVDMADAELLFNYVSYPNLRATTYKLACPENADVTGDGIIDIGDAVLLHNHLRFPDNPEYALREPEPDVITYEETCVGTHLFNNKYVNGVWTGKELIEMDSPDCGYVAPPEPEPVCTSQLLGDVNGDGVVDMADANLLFNYVSFPNLRATTYKLACPENADVTGNGTINIGDAILLMNHVTYPDDPAFALREPEPDLCADKLCTPQCFGYDLWGTKCVDGECVQVELLEANSSQHCGYVEPGPDLVCTEGEGRYPVMCMEPDSSGIMRPVGSIPTEVCVNNEWVQSDEECPEYDEPEPDDPCAGVICDNVCVGADLYAQKCEVAPTIGLGLANSVTAYCVPDMTKLIQKNCPDCPGYVEPGPELVCTEGEGRYPVMCMAPDASGIMRPVGAMPTEVCVNNEWVPSDEECPEYIEPEPEDPCAGLICNNVCIGANLHAQKCVGGVCVQDVLIQENCPDCPGYVQPPPHLCDLDDRQTPHTCWDGSQIYTEICEEDEFGGTAWVPSDEQCPMQPITRVMEMAIPEIVYVGQSVPIAVQTFCGAAASSGEPVTLQVDNMAIRTKTTLAGNAEFKWVAEGTGMRKVCAVIPINPNCPVPGIVCKTITVSAKVADVIGQIKEEKAKYDADLERLRELRDEIRKRPSMGALPGRIFVPPSLAGQIVLIGGKPITVPPNGISVPVVPGENDVVIVTPEGNINVEVDVPSGGGVDLPVPYIPQPPLPQPPFWVL